MNSVDVKQIKIAKRYAVALVESAVDDGVLQPVFQQLCMVRDTLLNSADLFDFLTNPIVSFTDKYDVIDKVFSSEVSDKVTNFLKLLVENSRFELFYSVIEQYSVKLDEFNNISRVSVVSAVNLDDEAKRRIVEKLEFKISKKVIAEYKVNPEIIAGLVIEVNNKTIDTSLKTKLNNIKKQLI